MDIKLFLDQQVRQFNQESFLKEDPIQIPKKFKKREDIEIAGFLTSIITWGNRKAIIKSASLLMDLMENEPYRFIVEGSESEWEKMNNFVYRTFNSSDLLFLMKALKNVLKSYGNLENIFNNYFQQSNNIKDSIIGFRSELLKTTHLRRSEKHLANPAKGSAAKRINMFLRWMVRKDNSGIDFGIWDSIPMSALMIPLDVHSGRMARNLGLLSRKQNDWKAVEELTERLKELDSDDPIKYDFALFGMGVNKVNPVVESAK